MSSSEIAKLETRWRENPQGLTFAPLAEAYRKMREPARALEVLAEGLGRHPDYIPASIVLGRCHLDIGNGAEAEAAFRRVLELDDENAIALRALADLAEQDGRLGEAAGRLQELLSVDRSNDDARAQLARIEAAIAAGPVVADASPGYDWTPEAPSVGPSDAPAVAAADDLMLEDNLHPTADVDPLPDLVVDDVPAISSESVAAPPLGDLVGKDFREIGAEVPPLSDLATGSEALLPSEGVDAAGEPEFEVSSPVELEPDFEAEVEPDLERASEIELHAAERSEFQVESATDEWMTDGTDRTVGTAWTDGEETAGSADAPALDEASEPGEASGFGATSAFEDTAALEDAPAVEDAPAFESATSPDDAPAFDAASSVTGETGEGAVDPVEAGLEGSEAAEPASEPETEPAVEAASFETPSSAGERRFVPDPEREDADLVVTETMAELYLRQGHRAEALRVYRELWLRSGDDLRLREKVDALETALAAEESGAEEPASPANSYSAPAPARSVAAFLGSILSARPAGAPPAWSGAPPAGTQPLTEQSRAESPDAAPTRPAADHLSLSAVFGETGSPVPPAVAAGAPADEDGISFDAFFGGDASTAPARARAASRDDDDLDQFHAWLQNLKR
jgi:tetratricopeptide (TPR) repeat protein